MSEVQFSGAELLLISGMLAAYTAGLGVLFRALLKAKDDQIALAVQNAKEQIAREREITDKVIPAIEEHTATVKRLIEIQTWDRESPQIHDLALPPPPPTTRRSTRATDERTR